MVGARMACGHRAVTGDQTYESLAHKGETMTTAATVTYSYDQIGQARTGLTDPPEYPYSTVQICPEACTAPRDRRRQQVA